MCLADSRTQHNKREWLSWWSTTLPRSGPRVRVPSRALLERDTISYMREWLSWWSTTLPRSGPRVRVPSRALRKSTYSRMCFFLRAYGAHTETKVDVAKATFRWRTSPILDSKFKFLRSASVRAKQTSTGRLAPSRALY